jgi:hypothetical protein
VAARKRVTTTVDQESSELAGGAFPASLVTSDTSIKAAPEPVELFRRVCKGGCDSGG